MGRSKDRIEKKTSRTAEYTCMSRAASFMEKRECYKGSGYISYILVPGFIKLVLRFPAMCKLYSKYLAPKKEGLEEKLTESGFEKNRKSLFILEGITMYLSGGAINTTFEFIKKVSGINSLVVFDYIYAGVLRQENRYYGEKEIFKIVSNAGEGWTFGFEQGEIEHFLHRYGFDLKDHSSARELEDRYFKDPEGRIIGMINGTHCILTGTKNSHRQKLLLDRKEDNVPLLGTIE
jgi:hypothetical protein